MKPWAFKVRGGGNATGIKGGPVMRWIGERIASYELSQTHETK